MGGSGRGGLKMAVGRGRHTVIRRSNGANGSFDGMHAIIRRDEAVAGSQVPN